MVDGESLFFAIGRVLFQRFRKEYLSFGAVKSRTVLASTLRLPTLFGPPATATATATGTGTVTVTVTVTATVTVTKASEKVRP